MGKVRVGIDVDGVLRDFDSKVMEIVKREFPDKVTSDIVHGWDFPNVNMDIKELSKLWRETHCEEIYRLAGSSKVVFSPSKHTSSSADCPFSQAIV